MKKLLAILFLLIPVYAYSLEVSGIDGGGNADTLNGQGADFYISDPSVFGSLTQETAGLGIPYAMGTSFVQYTSYNSSNVSTGVTADQASGTLTLASDQGGDYNIRIDISNIASGAPAMTYAVFVNGGESFSFERTIEGEHHHPPTFINLTSDTGGAAYDTYSSLDRLAFADSDEIWIDEASSGTNPIIFDSIFNGSVLYPERVEIDNILYDGAVAHEIEALMWNYSTTTWMDMRAETKDFPDTGGTDAFRYYSREFEVPSPISQFVDIITKEAKFRINHTSSGSPGHQMKIDRILLHDGHASAALSFSKVITLPNSAVISVRARSDISDIPTFVNNVNILLEKKP